MRAAEIKRARALVKRIKRGKYVIPDEGRHGTAAFAFERGGESHTVVSYFSETRAHQLLRIGNDEGQFG